MNVPRVRPVRSFTLAALSGALLAGCQRETRDTDIKLVRIADVKTLVDRQARSGGDLVVLIDPRPEKYYDEAHIPGARHVTLPHIDPKAKVDATIDRYGTIIVYGENPASAEARGMTKRLMAVGYGGVRLYAGGMLEWTGRGYPVDGHGATPVAPAPATMPAPAALDSPGAVPETPPVPETPAPVSDPAPPPPAPAPAPTRG